MITFIPSLIHADASEANVEHLIDHIMHVGRLIGYDHIGLGSDFDGMFSAVKGMEDVELYPSLVARMLGRGIVRSDIEKIIGNNIIRVFRDVEAQSAYCKTRYPILEEGVKQLWNDKFREVVEKAYPDAEKSSKVLASNCP